MPQGHLQGLKTPSADVHCTKANPPGHSKICGGTARRWVPQVEPKAVTGSSRAAWRAGM